MLENISQPAEQTESLRYNLFVSLQSCRNLPARQSGELSLVQSHRDTVL